MFKPKDELIRVYHDTLKRTKDIPVKKPVLIKWIDDPWRSEFSNDVKLAKKPCRVIVENKDSFQMAQDLGKKRVMVLNLASDLNPGGYVKYGCHTQEDELFRRSNYHYATSHELYPLDPHEMVYSSKVTVIKGLDNELLEEPFVVACLANPGIRKPELENGDYKDPQVAKLMKKKIYAIFKTAIYYEHRHIVLGALGCGVFNNPVDRVVEFFASAIKLYSDYFETIGFAILSRSGKESRTLKLFQELAT